MESAMGLSVLLIYLVIYGLLMLMAVATYIFTALPLYTIAKRRGLDKPWAAWIPIGDAWIIGCLSDHYRLRARYEYTDRGRDLLKHGIMLAIGLAVFYITWICYMVMGTVMPGNNPYTFMVFMMLGMLLLLLASMVFMIVITVRYMIRYYKALYDVYASCDPTKPVMFLLLSIFVSYAVPVCLMINRNNDYGIPDPAWEETTTATNNEELA